MAKSLQRPKYKYNIDVFLGRLPRSLKIQEVIKTLEEAGIPQHDFYRHRRIALNSTRTMSEKSLRIYASFFDCSIEELVNQPVNVKAASLRRFHTKLS